MEMSLGAPRRPNPTRKPGTTMARRTKSLREMRAEYDAAEARVMSPSPARMPMTASRMAASRTVSRNASTFPPAATAPISWVKFLANLKFLPNLLGQ